MSPSPMSSPTPSPSSTSRAQERSRSRSRRRRPRRRRLRPRRLFFSTRGGVRAGVPRRRVRANVLEKNILENAPEREDTILREETSNRNERRGRERLWGGAPAGVVRGVSRIRDGVVVRAVPLSGIRVVASRSTRGSTPAFAGGFERRRGRARGRVERRTRDNAPGGRFSRENAARLELGVCGGDASEGGWQRRVSRGTIPRRGVRIRRGVGHHARGRRDDDDDVDARRG